MGRVEWVAPIAKDLRMPLRLPSTLLVLLPLIVLLLGLGCGPKMSERTHARYELGAPFKYRPAEPGGLYRVKWAPTRDGPWTAVPGSEQTVTQGDLLGFMLDEHGMLIAIAGQTRFPISPLPRDAKVFVWATEFERKTNDAPSAEPPDEPASQPGATD